MKYNQIFYNYEGVFRYLQLGKLFQQKVKAISPSLDKTIRSAVNKRAENAKWRKLGGSIIDLIILTYLYFLNLFTTMKGLLRDDMIIEEHDVVVEALARLPKPVLHGRYARYKVALHQSLLRRELPESQWPKPEQVIFIVRKRCMLICLLG